MTKADADMALSILLRNQVLILRALYRTTERSDERSLLHEAANTTQAWLNSRPVKKSR